MTASKSIEFRLKHVLLSRNTLAVTLHRERLIDASAKIEEFKESNGLSVFQDLVHQNSACFWNQCLIKTVPSLEFRGCLVPMTILVGGSDFALEVIRSAWARRVLRPPKGYVISCLGDVTLLQMHPVAQTHFTPLSEAVCKVVVELNSEGVTATANAVASRLAESFPKMEVPSDEMLHKTLGELIRERKLYHTGKGYFIVNPDTYRQRAVSPLCERQMLMTNDEAIHRMHGDQGDRSMAIQVSESDLASSSWRVSPSSSAPESKSKTSNFVSFPSSSPDSTASPNELIQVPHLDVVERSHSLRVLRVKGRSTTAREVFNRCTSLRQSTKTDEHQRKDDENEGHQRCEKKSVFTKLFRRVQTLAERTNKHVTFSSQFPPLEWLESDHVHCQSVATQTQLQFKKSPEKKILPSDLSTIKSPTIWQASGVSIGTPTSNNSISKAELRKSQGEDNLLNGKKNNVRIRQGISKPFVSNRYSCGPLMMSYSKRHHRHRSSSSESSKIEKMKKKDTDFTDSRLLKFKPDNVPTFSATSKLSNPKAVISPCSVVYKPITQFSSTSNNANLPSVSSSLNTAGPSLTSKPYKAIVNPRQHPVVKGITISTPPKSVTLVSRANELTSSEKNNSSNLKVPLSEVEDVELVSQSSSSSTAHEDMKVSVDESCSNQSSEEDLKIKEVKSSRNLKQTPENSKVFQTPKAEKVLPAASGKNLFPTEIVIDNSVNVEVEFEKIPKHGSSGKKNQSTTVSQTVTEETTITKQAGNSKVVTVTNVTTSLSRGGMKELDKSDSTQSSMEDFDSENVADEERDVNLEKAKKNRGELDCFSTCNIITEVK